MTEIITLLALLFAAVSHGATVVDHYDFKASLLVPRIYNNTESLGTRKYQRQRLVGEMQIVYDTTERERPVVAIPALTNLTHRINGVPITYDCTVGSDWVMTRVNRIGSNKTEFFNRASLVFYVDAEPSYALESGEGNSLLATVAGYGSTSNRGGVRIISTLRGDLAGTLGCGCKAYGHVSPTRVAGVDGATDTVDDVASVFGTWQAVWKRRTQE